MIRLRPASLLLLLIGLTGTVIAFTVLLPSLAHLGHANASNAAVAAASTSSRAAHHGFTFGDVLLVILALGTAVGVASGGWWVVRCVRRRLANRLTRQYGLYEVRLSLHDQAREQEVVDMVEGLLNVLRAFPAQRARDGQPFIALEAHFAPGATGELEWLLCVRCERELAQSIDGILSAAYPDVRLGYEFAGPPRPVAGRLALPGHVLRFRKARAFIHPSAAEVENGAAHPWETIAQAQVALGQPSTVRVQLTPCALGVERCARTVLGLHEHALRTREEGQLGPLSQQEMTVASTAQQHAWCWLEIQVAAASRQSANRVAAVLQSRRSSNRLQRRSMVLRQDLYRRRFPTAYPPILPALSLRTLASAGEVAQLIALPSGRMKNVPVRRLALPRIPAPPEVWMTAAEAQPPLPPGGSE